MKKNEVNLGEDFTCAEGGLDIHCQSPLYFSSCMKQKWFCTPDSVCLINNGKVSILPFIFLLLYLETIKCESHESNSFYGSSPSVTFTLALS